MKKSAFTLVELIVVITILTILWTVWFISFKWYSSDARDSVRLTNLQNMETALHLYFKKAEKFPAPENAIKVDMWTGVKTFIWTFWNNVASKVKLSWDLRDPLTWEEFVYSTDAKQNNFELLTYLENKPDIVNTASANATKDNIFRSGDTTWIILKSDNSVIDSDFDYATATGDYKILLWDDILTWNKDLLKFTYAQITKDPSLENNLALYYDFQTTTPDGKLKDLSWNGHDWTKYLWDGNFSFWNEPWVRGKSTYFKGKNLIYSDNVWDDLQYDWSLSFSVRFNQFEQVSNRDHVMWLVYGAWSWGWTIFLTPLKALYFKAWNLQVAQSEELELNHWYNVIVVSDSSTTKVYLNGKLILNWANFPFIPIARPVTFGWTLDYDDVLVHKFDGLIDESKIYDRVLTEEEVKILYEQNKVD